MKLTSLSLLALLPFAPFARAQEADPKKAPVEAPIERLAAWPKPADKDQIIKDIERVVRMNVPEMAIQGAEQLVAAGASAVPFVLDRYAKEKAEDVQDRLHEILLQTTKPEHTRLLAKEFESKLPDARTFALWRVAAFPDPGVKAQAEAAWAKVVKQGERANPEERYSAALCAASAGSLVGLDVLFDACREAKMWDKRKTELRVALQGARGEDATAAAIAKLTDADRKQKVGVLRALAGCGTKSCVSRVKGFLDEEDNQIRIAAINALRGIVDGEPPIEDLSAFEAIETAKKWKARG